MPEGPEIKRAADNLEAAVLDKLLIDVWFAFPELKSVLAGINQGLFMGALASSIKYSGR